MGRSGPGELCCSFCGAAQRKVDKLIAGPGVYLCSACVELMADIMAEVPARPEPQAALRTLGAVDDPAERGLATLLRRHLLLAELAEEERSRGPHAALLAGPDPEHMARSLTWRCAEAGLRLVVVDARELLSDPRRAGSAHGSLGPDAVVCVQHVDQILFPDGRAESTHRAQRLLLRVLRGDPSHSPFGPPDRVLFLLTGDFEGLPGTTPDDLVRAGLLPALVDRLGPVLIVPPPRVEVLRALLDEEGGPAQDLVRAFAEQGVALSFSEGALDRLASEADRRGAGISGLRSLLEALGIVLAWGSVGPGELRVDQRRVEEFLGSTTRG